MRRSERLKRKAAAEEERFSLREKKRREVLSRVSPPSAVEDVGSMARGVWSDDRKLQLDATTYLLNLVSLEDYPLIDEVIQAGVVPRLVEFLSSDDYPVELQCEAARVLNNIAAGTSENTKVVIDCGAVPVFVKLLQSSKIYEQVAWALGNIAGDSPGCRDIVLNCGALHPLLTLLNEHCELSFQKIGTWALSNFFEGKPELPREQEACWALFYLSQCGGGIESAMYEAGLCPNLAMLYEHAPSSVLFPAFRTIASIVEGTKTMDEILRVRRPFIALYRPDLSNCILNEACKLKSFLDNHMDAIFVRKLEKMIHDREITS